MWTIPTLCCSCHVFALSYVLKLGMGKLKTGINLFLKDSTKSGDGDQVPDEKPTANNDQVTDTQSKEAGNKPVASQLIPGTPWCVVWTGDEKVFYFNPTTKVSVWEKPEDLLENDTVDEILEAGPEKKAPSEYLGPQ